MSAVKDHGNTAGETERESGFMLGERAALLRMLSFCCHELGYDEPLAKTAALIDERERAINALREVCEEYGCNDWPDNLYLADIIEKNLHRYLGGGDEDAADEPSDAALRLFQDAVAIDPRPTIEEGPQVMTRMLTAASSGELASVRQEALRMVAMMLNVALDAEQKIKEAGE